MMREHPDLVALLAGNDSMALGAVAAVKAAGKTGKVQVVGYDNIGAIKPMLQDGRADSTDVTATILDLAARGHMQIIQEGDGDWRFAQRHSNNADLNSAEQFVMATLFQRGNSVTTDELKQPSYAELLTQGRHELDLVVTRRGWFRGNLTAMRVRQGLIGLVLLLGGAALTFVLAVTIGWGLPALALALVGLLGILVGEQIPPLIRGWIRPDAVSTSWLIKPSRRSSAGRSSVSQSPANHVSAKPISPLARISSKTRSLATCICAAHGPRPTRRDTPPGSRSSTAPPSRLSSRPSTRRAPRRRRASTGMSLLKVFSSGFMTKSPWKAEAVCGTTGHA